MVYDDFELKLLVLVEDLVFNRWSDVMEWFIEFGIGLEFWMIEKVVVLWRNELLEECISYVFIYGNLDFIEVDMNEVLDCYPKVLVIIEGLLMVGMNIVGDCFGLGKMFLL